jgi:hypothetical protein
MKGNTVNDKIKAFYQKHESTIKIAALALLATGLFVAAAVMKRTDKDTTDNLTDEEWDHLIELARQMDEYVAERKALKTK